MRLSRRSRSALGGFLWLVLFYLLIFVGTARGQSEKPPGPPSLESNLTSLVSLSQTLISRLEERKLQVAGLQESLRQASAQLQTSALYSQDLEARLTRALESQSQLEADLKATQTLLDASEISLSQVGTSFADYRAEMQGQVHGLQRERDLWRWVAAGAGALAAILGVVAIAR